MAIDIRATVTCSLGTLISGSISDDYLQGSGLVKTRGSCEISALITPAVGTVVTFSYVKGGVTRSIPRKLRVLSSFADPFRRTTKVELGCKLTYLSDLKDRLDWTAFDDPENAALTEADAEIITIPIRASSIMTKCLTEIGITASSSPLTNQFSIPEFDFSPGYVQILSDLLVSESYFGYLDTSEVLQVRNLAVGAGTGPVFTSADIVDLGPIGVGQLPGEAVTVSYSTLKLRNSATDEGPSNEIPAPPDPVTEPEEYEIWDRGSQQARWEFSESIGAPTVISLQFPSPTGIKSFTYIPYTSINSTYTPIGSQEQLSQQIEISNSIAAADYGTYLVNIFTAGVPSVAPGVATQSRVVTTYSYGVNTRTVVKQQYEPYAKAAGGMSVPFAFSAGDYVILPSTEIKTAVTRSEVRISGSVTQTITTSYLLWHLTIEGQQAIAEGRQNFTNSAEVAAYINSIVSQGPVYAGTDILTQYTASLPPARPSRSDLINQSLAKDPEDTADEEADPTTYRTESVAELELAVGSSAAQRRIELSMPYAPDDRFTKSGTDYYAISSDAPQKASRYGRTQNRLLLGNRNGINLQLAPERLPAAPFEPLYVQANGLTAQYRANGTSWAFDSNGIVCSVDALFWSAVGGTGTFWFPVAPGITTLPATPAIVDGTMNPASTVLPYNETAVYEGRLRLGNIVTKFDYALELLSEPEPLKTTIGLQLKSLRLIEAPSSDLALSAEIPTYGNPNSTSYTVVPVLYTGTQSTQSVSGLPWSPSIIWLKARTLTQDHLLADSLRGATRYWPPGNTGAEQNDSTVIQSIDANGFTLGSNSRANANGVDYVAWAFPPVAPSSSNTAGTLTSTVAKANFFSIATYTGNGVAGATFGHGLSQAPELVIVKSRSGSAAASLGGSAVGDNFLIQFSSTNARSASTAHIRTTSSTVVEVGNNAAVNTNGSTYVAYSFHTANRQCKVGTYTGDGNQVGTQISCGFEVNFLIVKRRDGGVGGWNVIDSSRNFEDNRLLITNGTEIDLGDFYSPSEFYELTASGFIPKRGGQTTDHDLNINGSTYLYIAFGSYRPTVLAPATDTAVSAELPSISAT
jgi:hypothetical protein